MAVALSERRAHERAADEWPRRIRATLRPGHPILVVNISRGGALVESSRPLRPGTRVMLQFATSGGPLGLSAQILRCLVQAITPGSVMYRAALRFDERRDWTRELRSLAG